MEKRAATETPSEIPVSMSVENVAMYTSQLGGRVLCATNIGIDRTSLPPRQRRAFGAGRRACANQSPAHQAAHGSQMAGAGVAAGRGAPSPGRLIHQVP